MERGKKPLKAISNLYNRTSKFCNSQKKKKEETWWRIQNTKKIK